MFLKSLRMRGFKSFADRTVFEFEPGITVIVGPNGSGKSNVVDAIAWVMGTRSAKLLRGGELADVIFAGSPNRPALTRAEVEIVIDNSKGQLSTGALGSAGSAQQFAEVAISREIEPTGESTYRINGEECRLLDIQELLSDTGMGRELHTVVGQGQLDSILHAKPDERRAFIEEAAGILKHRRRRERAQRKLVQVDEHLDKLASILHELRRQLKPLERQAEAASKHSQLQAELRDVRIRLAADDLARLERRDESLAAKERQVRSDHDELAAGLEKVERRIGRIESDLREATPKVEKARETVERLARLRERLVGTGELIDARRRHLVETVEEPLAGRPPDELRQQAVELEERREEHEDEVEAARRRLEEAAEASRDAQIERREHERRMAAAAREQTSRREKLVRWQSDVRAREDAVESAEAEAGRLARRLEDIDERADRLREQVASVQEHIRDLDAEEWRLTEALEEAQAAVANAERQLEAATDRERELERERASNAARAEALRAATTDSGDGTAALLEADGDEVQGLLADRLRISDDAATAVAAALGPLGGAVVATSVTAARDAIDHLRDNELGRAQIVAPGGASTDEPGRRENDGEDRVGPDRKSGQQTEVDDRDATDLDGARPLISFISPRTSADGPVVAALRRALDDTYVVTSWRRAVVLRERYPRLTFVTRAGDVAAPAGFAGGSAPEGSVLVTAAAADDAEARVRELDAHLTQAHETVQHRRRELSARRAELEVATSDINDSDARITGAAEQLAQLHKELDGLERQRKLVADQRRELVAGVERHQRALADLRDDPAAAPDDGIVAELEDEGERLEQAVETARSEEIEVRLAVERLDQQIEHLAETAGELRREADAAEAKLASARQRRQLRRDHIQRCGELSEICARALEGLEASVAVARDRRDRFVTERARRQDELASLRVEQGDVNERIEAIRDTRHETELQRAEVRRDIGQVTERLRDEFGLTPDEALDEYAEPGELDRETLEERAEELDGKLDMMGQVNPLALEEFRALEDRHAFLSRQVEDLRDSKRDLNEIIDAVDDKIEEVFDEAFEDVAREFEEMFSTLFPGGRGRLTLTEPDDLLTTGVAVEARPPGKRVRRLSLLSGGERSLTALALLFAIFKARPSPFYVLDEVEAALDDVNLARLLRILESFKEHSQLLVVTHQRPTMEVADTLYGVTMGSEAVSKVVAERLPDAETVAV